MARKINVKVPVFSETDKRIMFLGNTEKALEFKRKMIEENVKLYGDYNYKILVYSNEIMNAYVLINSWLFQKMDEIKLKETITKKKMEIVKSFEENREIYLRMFRLFKEFEMYFKNRKYKKSLSKVKEIVNYYYENEKKDFFLSQFYDGILKRISDRLRKLVKRRVNNDEFLKESLMKKLIENKFSYWGLNFRYDKDGIEFIFSFIDYEFEVFQEFLRFKLNYKDFLKFKDELKKYLLISSI